MRINEEGITRLEAAAQRWLAAAVYSPEYWKGWQDYLDVERAIMPGADVRNIEAAVVLALIAAYREQKELVVEYTKQSIKAGESNRLLHVENKHLRESSTSRGE